MRKVYRDWRPIVAEFKQSGMSASAFAMSKKIPLSVFCRAIKRAGVKVRRGKAAKAQRGVFTQVGAPETIELSNGIGVTVRVSANMDPDRLATTIAAVAKASALVAHE